MNGNWNGSWAQCHDCNIGGHDIKYLSLLINDFQ